MIAESSARLSPPQYTFYRFIKYSIGNDPDVDVLDMEEGSEEEYTIPVHVKSHEKAAALATILEHHKVISNMNIYIEVYYSNQIVQPIGNIESVDQLLDIIKSALGTNRYYSSVKAVPVFTAVFPIFKKSVIQFWNDDLSDYYGNFNGVAADVFREVIRSPIAVGSQIGIRSPNEIFISPSTVPSAEEATAFTVTYLGKGATSGIPPVDNKKYKEGDKVIVLGPNTLRRSGYDFKGWSASPEGNPLPMAAARIPRNHVYRPGDAYTMPAANTVFSPVWALRESGNNPGGDNCCCRRRCCCCCRFCCQCCR